MNYYIIKDGMPGANIIFWLAASTILRGAVVSVMASFARKWEARSRKDYLASRLQTV
jgi:hypothetical protein